MAEWLGKGLQNLLSQFDSECHLFILLHHSRNDTLLYLVATPIGNLSDITVRALEVLREVDYILCEDTRRACKLLQRYEIKNRLVPFHRFNEKSRERIILKDLSTGQNIALLSDAGMPTIADPGSKLVCACNKLDIVVTTLPGPSAPLTALSLSGLVTERFQFVGFLPKQSGKRQRLIKDLLFYPGVSICFESPYRLLKTLQDVNTISPDHSIYIARELTKKFEEMKSGKPRELLEYFGKRPVKGELTLLIPCETIAN